MLVTHRGGRVIISSYNLIISVRNNNPPNDNDFKGKL